MKKLLGALLGLTLFLTGCGSGEEDAVKQAAEAFLTAQQNGDIENEADYMTAEAVEDLGTAQELEDMKEQYEAFGISADVMDEFMDSMVNVYKLCWQSWEIGTVNVDKDEATVLVKVKGISQDDMLEELDSAFGEQISLDWAQEHEEELIAYAQDHSETELMTWMMDQVLPLAGQEAEKKAADFEVGETEYRLSLEKEDGEWKVSNVEQRVD